MSDKRREGTKQLTLWVDEALLKKWDAFKRSYSVNRSAMIVTAVNEYMENHRDVQPNTKASMMIEQKLTEIKDVLDKKADITAEQAAIVNNQNTRARVLQILEMQPCDSERIAFLLGLDEMLLVEILSILRHDKLVTMDGEGIWHANKE